MAVADGVHAHGPEAVDHAADDATTPAVMRDQFA